MLLPTLRRLSTLDRKALARLVRCEHFNRREEVTRLYDYLNHHADRAESGALKPEALFAAAFPDGRPYDNRALRHIQSYLLDAVRRYLVLAELEADPAAQQLWLTRALRRRNLESLLEKDGAEALEHLEAETRRDARWHLGQYEQRQELLEGVSQRERSSRLDLRPLHHHLTAFYLADMLRHFCSALTHQAISAQTYDGALLDAVLALAEQGDWIAGHPPIALYYHACRSLLQPAEPAHFERWKTVLHTEAACFSPAELRAAYLLGINSCIRRLNGGDRRYLAEAFALYRAGLEQNLLAEDGWLSGFTYKNIVRIGTALGEHDWTRQFFERHKAALHPREREAVYRYNLAYLYFSQADYARALPLLAGLELDDRLNLLDARRMLVRSYFELGEFQPLASLLTSFEAYVRRQRDLGYHRDLYLRFIRFTRRLLELPPGDAAARKRLAREVETAGEVAEKKWLLEKLF